MNIRGEEAQRRPKTNQMQYPHPTHRTRKRIAAAQSARHLERLVGALSSKPRYRAFITCLVSHHPVGYKAQREQAYHRRQLKRASRESTKP
jgi:hypothetical protein